MYVGPISQTVSQHVASLAGGGARAIPVPSGAKVSKEAADAAVDIQYCRRIY